MSWPPCSCAANTLATSSSSCVHIVIIMEITRRAEHFKNDIPLLALMLTNSLSPSSHFRGVGGVVAQSVERATPDEEVPGSIHTVAACSLLVGSVSV